MTEFDDTTLRAALMPARRLEATDAEVARVLERACRGRPAGRGGSRMVAVVAAAVLLAGGAYAVPATNAAIGDIAGSFAEWVGGSDSGAPGKPLGADDVAPSWVRSGGGRLIAKTDGIALYVTRVKSEQGPMLGFSMGGEKSSIAGFNTIEGWRDSFRDHAVVVLGTVPAPHGGEGKRFPLFGVTARAVDRVELRYTSGPPLVADGVDGGFVLMADATRPLLEVVGYSADGHQLDRTDASTYSDPGDTVER
jgi:hypothetical protein